MFGLVYDFAYGKNERANDIAREDGGGMELIRVKQVISCYNRNIQDACAPDAQRQPDGELFRRISAKIQL